jgi:hypothetical protein
VSAGDDTCLRSSLQVFARYSVRYALRKYSNDDALCPQVRYMYVPLGGSSNRAVSVWIIFMFVGLWHDAVSAFTYSCDNPGRKNICTTIPEHYHELRELPTVPACRK